MTPLATPWAPESLLLFIVMFLLEVGMFGLCCFLIPGLADETIQVLLQSWYPRSGQRGEYTYVVRATL